MHVSNISIDELKPFTRNPKKHPEKQIKFLQKSFKEFGWTNPILVARDNMIVAGHGRWEAAKQAGFTEVPVIKLDMPYEKAVAYVIADNHLAELAETDTEQLAELLQEISQYEDFDIGATGFEMDDIESMLASLTDDVLVPNPSVESSAKKNELVGIDVNSFDKHVISFSGGKDSTLLVLWAVENLDVEKLILIYWDSGWNWPEETQYVKYISEKYNIPLILFGELDKNRILELIKQKGYPFYGNLWCQSLLKIKAANAMHEYLIDTYGDNILTLTGIRHVESKKREDYPEFYKSNNRVFMAPIRHFTDDDLIEYMKSHNEKLCPLYQYANRTGCAWCCNHDVNVRAFIKKKHPDILCDINEAIVDALHNEKWKICGTGFEETFVFFNARRDVDTKPMFSSISYTYEEFELMHLNDLCTLDLRGKVH